MRRNSITLLKYLVGGAVLLILGPFIFKQILGNRKNGVEHFVKADKDSLKGDNENVSSSPHPPLYEFFFFPTCIIYITNEKN